MRRQRAARLQLTVDAQALGMGPTKAGEAYLALLTIDDLLRRQCAVAEDAGGPGKGEGEAGKQRPDEQQAQGVTVQDSAPR